jgi:hypothetical protein
VRGKSLLLETLTAPLIPAIADAFGLSREMSCKTKARAASRIPTIESL